MISVIGENHIIGQTKATSDAEKLSYLGWVVVWAWGGGDVVTLFYVTGANLGPTYFDVLGVNIDKKYFIWNFFKRPRCNYRCILSN